MKLLDMNIIVLALIFLIAVVGLSYLIIIQHNTYMKNHPDEYPLMRGDNYENKSEGRI